MKQREFYQQNLSGDAFPDGIAEYCQFYHCDFSRADLSEIQFIHCKFYDERSSESCSFYRAKLTDASFQHCDLTMADFRHINALGLEIHDSKVQGADFRGASFMNMIGHNSYFCSASLIRNNFSYANFEDVVLEQCELSGNRWSEVNVLGAKFCGSDLSDGEFHHMDWASANFTHCNLTGCDLSQLDPRRVDLTGVQISHEQQSQLLEQLGLIIL